MTDATAELAYEGTYSFLLDAPTGEALTKLQIAKLGKGFKDARYGVFDITADQVHRWSQNLAKLPGGRAPIDLDHLADRAVVRRTEAAGWITDVTLEGGVPVAEVEWTSLGADAIRDKRYLFFSPTYGPWTDEKGAVTQDVLQGGALTNRPFLNMPTVCLATAEFTADPGVVELDARVGIGVGDRVTALDKPGVCVRADAEHHSYDVTFDDGTRAEALQPSELAVATSWESMTPAAVEDLEPADLQATLAEIARLVNHATRR